MAAIDDLILQLGNPGNIQVFVLILLGFNYFPVLTNSMIMAVYGSKVPFHCKTFNDTGVEDNLSTNITSSSWQQTCSVWEPDANQTKPCTTGWVYDTTEKSMITEWNLVCEEEYLVALCTSIFFAGLMIGGLVFGFLSDHFGRRPVILLTVYGQLGIGLGLYVVPSYIWFLSLRFFQGIFLQGLQTTSYAMVMEMFRPAHRSVVGVSLEIFWGSSFIVLSGIWYFIQNWRYIQLAITLPTVLTLSYIWVLPESLRWLLSKKKFHKAEKLVKRMVKCNNVVYPETTMMAIRYEITAASAERKPVRYTVLDLFKTPVIRRRSIILFYTWFSAMAVYLGLSLGATNLAGNKYLNLFISGAVEFPAYLTSMFVLRRFGRRIPMCVYFVVCGLMCIGSGFVHGPDATRQKISVALAMFGKYCTAGLFTVVFMFAAELYPTVIRNVGCGACAVFMKAGGLVAPLVLRLGDVTFQQLPILIFGGLALLAGALTLLLPETLNRKLADNIEDVEIYPAFRESEKSSNGLLSDRNVIQHQGLLKKTAL